MRPVKRLERLDIWHETEPLNSCCGNADGNNRQISRIRSLAGPPRRKSSPASEGRTRRVVADREPAAAPGLVRFVAAGVIALIPSGDHVAGNRTPTIPHRPDVLGGHQAQVWACTHKTAIGGSDLINVRFADSS